MSERENILNDILIKTIEENLTNRELRQMMTLEFNNKGFCTTIIEDIFEGTIAVNTLLDNQKIAVCNAMLKTFKVNDKEMDIYKVAQYFPENKLLDYEELEPSKTNVVENIVLENFVMINDYEYHGEITYKQLSDYYNNNLLFYNMDSQRESNLKKLGNIYAEVPSIDSSAVNSIKELVLSNKFEDTQIVLNCRMNEFSAPKIRHEKVFSKDNLVIRDLYIDQKLDVVDGMHRIMGIANAVTEYKAKNKDDIKGSISVRFVIREIHDARRIAMQSFKRSDTGKNYLNVMEENDYTKFFDLMLSHWEGVSESDIPTSYKKAIAFKKTTYKELVITMIKRLNIKVNDLYEKSKRSKQLGKQLSYIYALIEKYIKENENCNVSLIKNVHMFAVYMQYAFNNKEEEYIDEEELIKLIDKISNLDTKEIKELKLTNEACELNKLIEHFVN